MKDAHVTALTIKTRKSPEYAVDFRSIKTESGIPIPEDSEHLGRRSNGSRRMYPLETLKVGDSFSFPYDPARESKQWTSINTSIRQYQKAVDTKAAFVVRVVRKEGVIRCWRVKPGSAR